MTDVEFFRWKAWYQEPRGEMRTDWHFARLMHMYHAAHRKKGSSAGNPSEWLLEFKENALATADELRAKLEALASRWSKNDDGS